MNWLNESMNRSKKLKDTFQEFVKDKHIPRDFYKRPVTRTN